MPEHRTSIRTYVTIFAASVAIPLLGLLGVSKVREFDLRVERENRELLSQAEGAALGIAQFLRDSERLLRGLAEDPHLKSLSPEDCDVHLVELSPLFLPVFTNLLTVDSAGVPVCSVVPQPPVDSSGPPGAWFEGAWRAEEFYISPVLTGRASGRQAAALAFPLRDPEGQRVGLVALGLDLIHFEEFLVRMNPEESGIITLFDLDGKVVARSRDSDRYVGTVSEVFLSDFAEVVRLQGRGTSEASAFEGPVYVWGWVRIPDTEWVVFAGLPKDAVYGPLYARFIRSGLVALLVLGFAFVLGRNLYRRITTPLAELVTQTAAAKPGDPAPLEVRGPDEIAQVATRFNQAWESWARAEEERRRSVERIRSLVENAVTGIYVSTEGGRFLEVNQAMVDLLGYDSREELLSTPVSGLYDSVRERQEYLADHGRKDFFRGVEVLWRKKDGTPIRVRLFGRRFRNFDGETSWEVIVEDVTRFRSLQDQYLQSQKMEALGRLAGGVAHDFNNLLTVVQGQADLILEDPLVGEDLKAQIQEISDAATRGGKLNRQLLAFGRRAGERKETLDLNKVLRGFELMIRRATGEEIPTELYLSPELGWILGDRGQLEQVVMNLVVNARDAMPRGGNLHIETYNTEVSDEEAAAYPPAAPGPHVVLAVSDTGTGIGPDVLPNIFEPFFSTKPETKGTGLGLSTVYGIVTELGGHIRVESTLGRGTTFRLFFPLQEARPAEETKGPEGTAPRTGSGLILLAEDEGAVRRLTTRILERAGYEVLSVADGREALEVARGLTVPLDLLLSDVVMPEIRGPELAEILAKEGRVRRAVFFSGYPEGLREAGLRGLDAWELIPKPFSSGDLLSAVARVLGREKEA
jgi:PAS domain S-box-containing protein